MFLCFPVHVQTLQFCTFCVLDGEDAREDLRKQTLVAKSETYPNEI